MINATLEKGNGKMTKCIRRYNTPMEVFQYLGQPVDEWPEWLQEFYWREEIEIRDYDIEPHLYIHTLLKDEMVMVGEYIVLEDYDILLVYEENIFDDIYKELE